MKTIFNELPDFLQRALAAQGIKHPTDVQAKTIPAVLAGRDVLATAQTGTGKTLAFLLPLAVRLLQEPEKNALILSPTRELAQQTYDELKKLTNEENPLPAVLIIGGDNIHKQFADLRTKPRVIVATPGRVIDHLQRKSIDLRRTHYFVLDETDRMLDMGFIDDMRRIAAVLPMPRQTLLFSATLPPEIVSLAAEFLTDPVRIQIGSVQAPVDCVLQEIIYLDIREKLPQLIHELNTRAGSVLIFTRTKHGAERLAKQLKLYGQKVNALHGDLRQNRRRQVLEFFRNQTMRILVATDVAARGIDVTHIAHVINYDLPQSPEDYIHRIGRTGRAGAVGNAVSFIAGDEEKWKEICKAARFSVPVKVVQKTIAPLPAPKFVATEESAVQRKKRVLRVRTVTPAAVPAEKNPAKAPVPALKKQAEKTPQKPKKIVTFQKNTHAAAVLEKNSGLAFNVLKVGVKKSDFKKENKKTARKSVAKPPRTAKPFSKFRKHHHR